MGSTSPRNALDPEIEKRLRLVGTAIVGTLAFLALVDFVFLRGDKVYAESAIQFPDTQLVTVEFDVEATGKYHSVLLDTGARELALGWVVVDARGHTIEESTEVFRRKHSRRFSFLPEALGKYALTVQRLQKGGGFSDSIDPSAKDRDFLEIEVRAGGRGILGGIFDWIF